MTAGAACEQSVRAGLGIPGHPTRDAREGIALPRGPAAGLGDEDLGALAECQRRV